MTEARKLVMQSAFLRKIAALEEARSADRCGDEAADADIDSDAGGYECEFGDGEDSGYTEIPMMDGSAVSCGAVGGGGSSGLRDRVARFVFRSRQTPPPQLQPPPPPQTPPASAQSRRRQSPAEFSGYAYTRWAYQPAVELARSRPTPPSTPPLTKSVSARTVRFRCPYEETASAADVSDSTLIRPYSTSTFACPPPPPPPLPLPGERSASSGYGSDMDAGPAASPGDHWAVREEDIDRLLFAGRGRQLLAPQHHLSPRQQQPTLPGDAGDDDLDMGTLDLTAFFPPAAVTSSAATAASAGMASASQIDRIVGDVVRLKGAAAAAAAAAGGRSLGRCQVPAAAANPRGNGGSGSPWRQQRREFASTATAASGFARAPGPGSASAFASDCFEMAEVRPAGRSYGLANYCQ